MPDYKTMYFDLFNSVTDAIEILCEAQSQPEGSDANWNTDNALNGVI